MHSTSYEPSYFPDPANERAELAVLFHLVDVSRPRSSPRRDQMPTMQLDQPPSLSKSPFDVQKPDRLQFSLPTSVHGSSPAVSPEVAVPKFEQPSSSIPEQDVSHYSVANSERSVTGQFSAVIENATSPLEAKAAPQLQPPKQEPVTPAHSPASRRRLKTPPGEDWFATHGKVIAVAFVLALIGTIYLARTNRKQAVGDQPLANADSQLQQNADEQQPSFAPGGMTTQGHSPAISAISDSKVELHAPVLVVEASTDAKSPASDRLFDFPTPKKSDERLASRPDTRSRENTSEGDKTVPANASEPISTSAPPQSNLAPSLAPPQSNLAPPLGPAQSNLAPQTAGASVAAAMPTAYPLTSAPPLVGAASPMATMPAPAGYASASPGPPADYRNQFQMQAATYPPQAQPNQSAAQAWVPPTNTSAPYQASAYQSQAYQPGTYQPGAYQPGAYQPGAYQPIETARGPRNERTGSGNY
jgi:hypothetical protein